MPTPSDHDRRALAADSIERSYKSSALGMVVLEPHEVPVVLAALRQSAQPDGYREGIDFYGAALAGLNAGAPGMSPDMRKGLAANIALRCRDAVKKSAPASTEEIA